MEINPTPHARDRGAAHARDREVFPIRAPLQGAEAPPQVARVARARHAGWPQQRHRHRVLPRRLRMLRLAVRQRRCVTLQMLLRMRDLSMTEKRRLRRPLRCYRCKRAMCASTTARQSYLLAPRSRNALPPADCTRHVPSTRRRDGGGRPSSHPQALRTRRSLIVARRMTIRRSSPRRASRCGLYLILRCMCRRDSVFTQK